METRQVVVMIPNTHGALLSSTHTHTHSHTHSYTHTHSFLCLPVGYVRPSPGFPAAPLATPDAPCQQRRCPVLAHCAWARARLPYPELAKCSGGDCLRTPRLLVWSSQSVVSSAPSLSSRAHLPPFPWAPLVLSLYPSVSFPLSHTISSSLFSFPSSLRLHRWTGPASICLITIIHQQTRRAIATQSRRAETTHRLPTQTAAANPRLHRYSAASLAPGRRLSSLVLDRPNRTDRARPCQRHDTPVRVRDWDWVQRSVIASPLSIPIIPVHALAPLPFSPPKLEHRNTMRH